MPLTDRFLEPPRAKRWPWWGIALIVCAGLFALLAGGAVALLWYVSQDLPSLDSVTAYQPSQVTRVYSDDRQLIGQFYVERRILTPLSEVPRHMAQAVVAVEDLPKSLENLGF